MTNSHFRKNSLVRIKIYGIWLTEDQEIREGVTNAFHLILSDNMDWRAEIDGLSFSTLKFEEARSLEVPFKEDKVLEALNDMNSDKAPSANDFIIAFDMLPETL